MEVLRRPGTYDRLKHCGETIMGATREHLGKAGIAHQIVGDPVLFDVVFTDKPVKDYRDVLTGDEAMLSEYNKHLRDKGLLKSPGKTYPCLALTDEDLDKITDAIAYAAKRLSA